MQTNEVRLGICFFENQLFYTVKTSDQPSKLEHVGAIDFNFDLSRALFENQDINILNLKNGVTGLAKQFDATHLHLLVPPKRECWSVLPKLVYDDAKELEAHIKVLMHGVKRENIHTTWHTLSNEKFKLLNLRTEQTLNGIRKITSGVSNIYLNSTFEIGEHWINHQRPGGSFLTVGCFNNCIAVSSFILGQLRGTTYITFDQPEDLPYLWLQQSQTHQWMRGLHEQIQFFGVHTTKIIELLSPFFDDSGTITEMNSLKKMDVTADEKTYGFDLSLAYPAIMVVL